MDYSFNFGVMEHFDFFDELVIRVPRYPRERLDWSLEEALKDPVFRDAIFLASDVVYNELRKHGFQADRLTAKMKTTLRKYLVRMATRSTPFGGFSSVSTLAWARGKKTTDVQVMTSSFETRLLNDDRDDETYKGFRINPTIYRFGEKVRLYDIAEHADQKRLFTLSEIDLEALPEGLLNEPGLLGRSRLAELLEKDPSGEGDWMDDVLDLVDSQIIVPVSGTDKAISLSTITDEIRAGKGAGLYSCTTHRMDGQLGKGLQDDISGALSCLRRLMPQVQNPWMENFKQLFVKRFDRREVPLLYALDPEAGIDYSNTATWTGKQPGDNGSEPAVIPWGRSHELLLRKWTGYDEAGLPVIALDAADMKSLSQSKLSTPPSQAVLFSKVDDRIRILAAGGVTGISLIGRFTGFDRDISHIASRIADMESLSNPDVIFAEVIHETGDRTDNVNIRTNFRNYVIPVLTDVRVEERHRIDLNDLWLSFQEGELILWSKRLKRRVIPRLSTAYNHRLSPLSVFRFLCDLQGDGVEAGYNFSLSKFFPGLQFYPQVRYKNVILDVAAWHLDAALFEEIRPGIDIVRDFEKLASKLNLPEIFVFAQRDQQLVIRRKKAEDLELLLQVIGKDKIVVLREYLEEERPLVTGPHGDPYHHELVAFLFNKRQVYRGFHGNDYPESSMPRFHPLDEWHYLKLYMNPSMMDRVLREVVSPFLKKIYWRDTLKQWFFVRYQDPEPHLRIRFRSKDGKGFEFVRDMQGLLYGLRSKVGLRDIKLASYDREVERYAAIGIETAELLFHYSTELALQTLGAPDRPVVIPAAHIHQSLVAAGFDRTQCHAFVKGMFEALLRQMGLPDGYKKEWDKEYRTWDVALINEINSLRPAHQYFQMLRNTVRIIAGKDRNKVLADLNHMHLNRIFSSDALLNEAQCYYWLDKLYNSTKHPRSLPLRFDHN